MVFNAINHTGPTYLQELLTRKHSHTSRTLSHDLSFDSASSHLSHDLSFDSASSHLSHDLSFDSASSHLSHDLSCDSASSHLSHDLSFDSASSHLSHDLSFDSPSSHLSHDLSFDSASSQVSPRSRECRSKKDECDLAENCDGKSNICPEDVFVVNGLPCDGDLGFCFNGRCPQRMDQCAKLYGASAIEAGAFCYRYNTRGLYWSFCKRTANDRFIPCQREDIFCGKLFCEGGSGNPNYGRMVKVGNCKAAFFGDFTKDYGQVDTGTRCGEGKVCSQNECVELQTAYRNTNCSAKCQGHAVCNHRSECQCEAGWMPPRCSSKEGLSTGEATCRYSLLSARTLETGLKSYLIQFNLLSLSAGATVAIALTVILVVLGVIAGVIGFICKKRQSPMLPTSHTQRKLPAMLSQQTTVQVVRPKPKGAPPPPPPAGNRDRTTALLARL
ncbi:disintegrin and metalloproteinase domain-containing protein 28-like [Trematomus bernacchii]|uniref:disintegrin and metalloproteinase domain-containing protein 28-like n=1 Tax=Trematomus bernacchii TaxID=40690 RepID=UPI00146A7770|nr:disintegrin and metalloproteinase domain-containing protein 28-like [Trematomus bernacchii]